MWGKWTEQTKEDIIDLIYFKEFISQNKYIEKLRNKSAFKISRAFTWVRTPV